MKKLLNIQKYLFNITLFTEALPFIFLLLFSNRIKDKGKREFFIYAILTALSVTCLFLFRYTYPNKNTYFSIVRIHNVIEFSIVAWIFSLFFHNKIIKKIVAFAPIPFFIICLIDYLSAKTLSIAYVPLLTECLFFIALLIYFFFEKMKLDVNEPLFNTFIFWIAVAFLINFSGNFLLFVYSETSNKEPDFKTNYTIIYSTVTIIKNILLCIAVTMKESVNKNNSSNNSILTIANPLIFTPDKTSSI
ncbi:hypothetical protein [Ferruginibacter sp.]